MINIKTLKNYIHRNLQDKYYHYIRQNIPDNKDKFLDAKINVTFITKNNKVKYIEYTLTIVTEYKKLDKSDILIFLEPAEKLINTYLKN